MRKVVLFTLLIIAGAIIIGSGESKTSTGEISFQDNVEVIELKINGQDNTQKVFYITEEEVVNLGFNTKKYLPENFDPYIIQMKTR